MIRRNNSTACKSEKEQCPDDSVFDFQCCQTYSEQHQIVGESLQFAKPARLNLPRILNQIECKQNVSGCKAKHKEHTVFVSFTSQSSTHRFFPWKHQILSTSVCWEKRSVSEELTPPKIFVRNATIQSEKKLT